MLGGIVMGLGIVGMHYTGMAAMRMAASLHYDRPLVALSVLIAIGAATVALWLTLRWQNLFQKTVSAIAMGLAISGMHYTGMAAATFAAMPDGDHPHGHISLQQTELAFAIGGTTVLILCLALIASLIDRRFAQFAERQAIALRQAERSFRLLVQGVTDYAICMLDPLGYVTSWNPGAQRIKGYAAEEIVGRHFSQFYTQEDIDAGQPRLALETALRDGRYETEGWRVRKDGKRFWGNIIIDCIRDDQGTELGFAKITRDMTERRNAQRILNDAREQLFQAQKMEAIGQLTGGDSARLQQHADRHHRQSRDGAARLANRDSRPAQFERRPSAAELVARRGADRIDCSLSPAGSRFDPRPVDAEPARGE